MKGLMISAPGSGAGKTTVTLALMQAMQARGVRFSPYKAGPDFIDPLWHRAVTGRASYNLEPHMMSMPHLLSLLDRAEGMPVVEGVGGLFCGAGESDTATLARACSLPVLFVVDAAGMAGSIAPLVAGFSRFRPDLEIIGVIANQVGSVGHAGMLHHALQAHALPPLLGWLHRDEACRLPERHLGLHLPHEEDVPDFSGVLHLEDAFWQLLQAASRPSSGHSQEHAGRLRGRRIAVARDEAFCFIYPANVEWIAAEGGESVFFSPLAGERVPGDADALWLPGGYPELHAGTLARQQGVFESVRDFIEADKPVLAECGGMMVLGESLADRENGSWPMAGILPFDIAMQEKLASLGYRRCLGEQPLCGHEFHYSLRSMHQTMPAAFDIEQGDQGVAYRQLRASYCHWYFPSSPDQAARLFGAGI